MISSLDTAPVNASLDWDADIEGHLRVSTDDERARIEGTLVPTARDWVEGLTNRQLVTATWKFWWPSFEAACASARRFGSSGARKYIDGTILIPRPPLQSVTWVKYYDTANVQQTWASTNYTVTTVGGPKAGPGWLLPVPTASFPGTYDRPDAVEIKAVCGYGPEAEDVPGGLRAAQLLYLAELFERRELAVVGTIVADAPIGAVNLALPYLVEI